MDKAHKFMLASTVPLFFHPGKNYLFTGPPVVSVCTEECKSAIDGLAIG